MTEARFTCPLDELGVIGISGRDAVPFLQGQLSNDMVQLNRERALLAGLHNPQGRVLALLRLQFAADGTIRALLHREMLSPIIERLRRFVLRSQVTIDEERSARVTAYCGGGVPRRYILEGECASADDTEASVISAARWRQLEIADGLPEVYDATSGQFISQMLNLDCIDAISWTKGCYTGQEIIARSHYRGRVKRRMQRFRFAASSAPQPASTHTTSDGISIHIVRGVMLDSGKCEVLAVAPVDAKSNEALALAYALPE